MGNKLFLFFGVVLFYNVMKVADAEIYYRLFNGTIASDALVAGNNGADYFVGLGVAHGIGKASNIFGLIPGKLTPGAKSMQVSIGGAVTVIDGLMILCGTAESSISWIAVTNTSFYEDLQDTAPVYGGREGSNERDYAASLYVGREGNNVGKVTTDVIALYAVDSKGKEQSYTSFEVLTIDNN